MPFLLTITAFSTASPLLHPLPPATVPTVVAWSFLVGLRGILGHQVLDVVADRAGGVPTIAARRGPVRTMRLVATAIVPSRR